MGWPVCNSTLEDMKIKETPFFENSSLTFHRLVLIISAAFGLIAIAVSLFLMVMHATHYSRPKEQRHIIRILFMVPVYAMVSFLSIYFYHHSVYYEVLRDCYEAFAIASFFSLMCSYLGDDLHNVKNYFRQIKPKPWIWPMKWIQKCTGGQNGAFRTPRSGLTWFNIIWVAVFQYCFIRVSMTITAVITQHFDRYCLESLNPAFAHVWVMVIEAIAVTITMYCIIQFYVQVRESVAQHKPFLKVLSIKLVIFLSFWQTIIISFLTSSGAINASERIQTPDIKVGIPGLLLCIEMALFSILHLWSFSYRPYVIGSKQYEVVYGGLTEAAPQYYGGPGGIKAFGECWNPWDLIKATGRSAKWLFRDRRHRMKDSSYETVTTQNVDAQKMTDLNSNTTYGGAGGAPSKQSGNMEEGSGLLGNGQRPTHQNPFTARENEVDSGNGTPWTEVESKEYFQDQQMRNESARRGDFQTAHTNQYDAGYEVTHAFGPAPTAGFPAPQETGILRPAGTDSSGRTQPNLRMVTKQDIEDLQQHRTRQVPYPRSDASYNIGRAQ